MSDLKIHLFYLSASISTLEYGAIAVAGLSNAHTKIVLNLRFFNFGEGIVLIQFQTGFLMI